MSSSILQSAQIHFKQGQLSQAKKLYHHYILSPSSLFNNKLYYDSLVNLATIQLQSNDLQKSKQLLINAIKMNPERYQAIYNLAIVFYYLSCEVKSNCSNTETQLLKANNLSKSKLSIQYCISILYMELGIHQQSLKYLNKSIQILTQCKITHNPKIYIHRGLIFQKQQKIKLAENQFQRIMYEIDQNNMSNESLEEIYLQKALFYRRINKRDKIQENLKLYLRYRGLKEEEYKTKLSDEVIGQYKNHLFKNIFLTLLNAQNCEKNETLIDQKLIRSEIQKLVSETQTLIKDIQIENSKSSNDQNVVSQSQVEKRQQIQKIKQKQNSQYSSKFEQNSNKERQIQQQYTIQQQKSQKSQQKILSQAFDQQQNLLEDQPPSFKQSHPSQSINEDEDSAILNQRIQRLQRQIMESGGNVPQVRDISADEVDQDNFLEFQIQRTIEEINNKKKQQQRKTATKVKQSNKNINQENQRRSMKNQQQDNVQKVISPRQSAKQGRISQTDVRSTKRDSTISDDKLQTQTLRSKLSQAYQLNFQQIKSYESFRLQVRSITMFDQKCPKKQAFVQIKYNNKTYLTQKCKNDKLTWNHTFDEQFAIKHTEDESEYQIQVQTHAKQGGWLSWHSDFVIGNGTIKLTDKGETKCTLQNKGKKVGILYYKLKLKMKQQL